MKLLVLDDFPVWTTYLLGLVVLCGFLFALMMLLRSLWVSKSGARAARPGRQACFFVIAGALAVWFLGSSMYLRFHAVGIGPREIELIFFWPRPAVSLGTDDLVDVKLLRAYRTCGHLEIATRQEIFRSVNFKRCEGAEEILNAISGHVNKNV